MSALEKLCFPWGLVFCDKTESGHIRGSVGSSLHAPKYWMKVVMDVKLRYRWTHQKTKITELMLHRDRESEKGSRYRTNNAPHRSDCGSATWWSDESAGHGERTLCVGGGREVWWHETGERDVIDRSWGAYKCVSGIERKRQSGTEWKESGRDEGGAMWACYRVRTEDYV